MGSSLQQLSAFSYQHSALSYEIVAARYDIPLVPFFLAGAYLADMIK